MFFIAYPFKGQVHVFAGRVKIVSHSSCRTSAILKYFGPLVVSCRTSALGRITRVSHISYYSLMFFIAYAFKGQVHVFAGQVKIESRSSCRTSAILKYFCPFNPYEKGYYCTSRSCCSSTRKIKQVSMTRKCYNHLPMAPRGRHKNTDVR